jgi:hypothetical protein
MFKLIWVAPTFDNNIKIMIYNKCLTIKEVYKLFLSPHI